MSQEQQREVGLKYDSKLRSCHSRCDEIRTLDDSSDNHLLNGSRGLRPTNGRERLKSCYLLRDNAIETKARETMAESCECGHCTLESTPSSFGRKCTGVPKHGIG